MYQGTFGSELLRLWRVSGSICHESCSLQFHLMLAVKTGYVSIFLLWHSKYETSWILSSHRATKLRKMLPPSRESPITVSSGMSEARSKHFILLEKFSSLLFQSYNFNLPTWEGHESTWIDIRFDQVKYRWWWLPSSIRQLPTAKNCLRRLMELGSTEKKGWHFYALQPTHPSRVRLLIFTPQA